MQFEGRLFAGQLFRGRLFGRRQRAPSSPDDDGDYYPGRVTRAGVPERIQRQNRELIMAVVSIVTSGVLECP
jgi:hypothetical protein